MRLAAFAPFFVWESLRGGVDVALRVVGPSLRVRPGFVAHRLRLPEGPARVSFANCVSLLPGSLAADLEGDELIVHLLDVGTDAGLARLEAAVARVYGVALEPRGD